MKTPKKAIHQLTHKIEVAVEDLLHGTEYWERFKNKNFDCLITDTNRGRCTKRNLTVPLWAYKGTHKAKDKQDYFIYYLAHELSHIFARGHCHKRSFYNIFKKICPKYLQKYEIGYKPSCVAYGISR